MTIEQSNLISHFLFDVNGKDGHLMHAGTGISVGPDLKSKLMEVYNQQSLAHCNKSPHNTPINERNIEIIHVLPTLAKTPDFIDKFNRHAQNFCRVIESKIADSKEIQIALQEMEKLELIEEIERPEKVVNRKSPKVRHLKESFKELEGVGNFLESILEKYDNKDLITENEKKIFRFLLASLLKIDLHTDDSNMAYIIKELSRYFHPDKSGVNSDLYSSILNKGFRLARVVENGFSHELYDDPLMLSIANLKKLGIMDRIESKNKIKEEMLALKASDLKDNYKEKLLMLIIKCDQPCLLGIMINRLGINNLKVNNETLLIYAVQSGGSELVIKKLIENGDVNALSLEGKTPLQVAIGCYKNWNDENPLRPFLNPYEKTIQWILDYHKLCVDAKDSKGRTALCYIILLWKMFDLSSFQLMYKLINRGASIDQPIDSDVTVRGFLQRRLTKNYFSKIATLADNPEENRIDPLPLIQSIANLYKPHSRNSFEHKDYEKIIEKMQALKASDLNGNDKEKLLMSIIQSDLSFLLNIMIYRLSIDNLKVDNETPLIYAIQNGGELVIKTLIDNGDVNALGLEGKTPLQIAISGYKEWKDKNAYSSNPYEKTIQRLLDCHQLCVDAKDSEGRTALCHIALQQKIDSTSLQFINQLINLGANIDQPIMRDITVRSILKERLDKEQFSDIERLADNLGDIRNGVEFHGDEIVSSLSDAISTTGVVPTNSGNTVESSNSPFT
ncbi:ankyrin repeat domain-containing protein [Endozoicomonas sp. YOMI1]|uniref:ankyrin repeat domain-containing protein n=1 Tax=Endozoicomonas sp. YOMI1 TaxID=2828739 RepID=UPI00214889C8|nr:ankyrin repeat domain-containing protein [Endozoicomonas sp. YOMI1]